MVLSKNMNNTKIHFHERSRKDGSAVFHAVMFGYASKGLIEYLLRDCGLEVNTCNADDETPLHMAVKVYLDIDLTL